MSVSRYTHQDRHGGEAERILDPPSRRPADSGPSDAARRCSGRPGRPCAARRAGTDLALHAIPEVSGIQQVQGQGIERVAAFGALDSPAGQRRAA